MLICKHIFAMVTSLGNSQPNDLPTIFSCVLISFYICRIDFCTSHLNQALNSSALTVIENKFPICFPLTSIKSTHDTSEFQEKSQNIFVILFLPRFFTAAAAVAVCIFIYLLVLMRCRTTCHICRTLFVYVSPCVCVCLWMCL